MDVLLSKKINDLFKANIKVINRDFFRADK